MPTLRDHRVEVAKRLAAGSCSKEIAFDFGVTPETLRNFFLEERKRVGARTTFQWLAIMLKNLGEKP